MCFSLWAEKVLIDFKTCVCFTPVRVLTCLASSKQPTQYSWHFAPWEIINNSNCLPEKLKVVLCKVSFQKTLWVCQTCLIWPRWRTVTRKLRSISCPSVHMDFTTMPSSNNKCNSKVCLIGFRGREGCNLTLTFCLRKLSSFSAWDLWQTRPDRLPHVSILDPKALEYAL